MGMGMGARDYDDVEGLVPSSGFRLVHSQADRP